jgi:hypothetical protein
MRRKTVLGLLAERTVCPHPEWQSLACFSQVVRLPTVILPASFAITPVTLLLENIRHYSVQWGGSSTLAGARP